MTHEGSVMMTGTDIYPLEGATICILIVDILNASRKAGTFPHLLVFLSVFYLAVYLKNLSLVFSEIKS